YLLTAAVIVIIPFAVGRAGSIAQRLSLCAAILLLIALGPPARSQLVLGLGVASAAVFFGLLFRDLGVASSVKARIEALVAPLPFGTRVVSYLPDPPFYK